MGTEMLYLDYAASAPLGPAALKVLETSMREDFANPASAHRLGRELLRRIEDCRQTFLQLLGTHGDERVVFTGSATESNNMVIGGLELEAGDGVVVSLADHPSVTVPAERLKDRGVRVIPLPLHEDGTPDEAAFFPLLSETVKLVILTHVNNQSGTMIDIARLSREIKIRFPKSHIHVDGAQGFGKIPLLLREGQIDSLSLSSHKIGGPKGVAGLVLRGGVRLSPLLLGGGQEGGLRSSTQAAPLVFSFCEAAGEAVTGIPPALAQVTQLNRFARHCLQEKIPAIRFPFAAHSTPYILTFILPGISSDIILRHLEQKGIILSSTSACSSKLKGIDPVFTALHLPKQEHKFVLRASFAPGITEADLLRFCNTLASIYRDLKKLTKS
jgi:cysteine desulfurase